MHIMRGVAIALVACVGARAMAQADPTVLDKIIDEGKNRNQVMKHLRYLTKDIGHRLTGSTNLQRACEWTADQFRSFGLQNVRLEKWGEVPVGFDRGKRQIARMVSPTPRDFEFTSPSWTPGTAGLQRGVAVKQPTTLEEFETVKAKLKGAWLVTQSAPRRGGQVTDEQAKLQEAIDGSGALGLVYGSRNELVITSGRYTNLTMETLPKDVRIMVRKSDIDAIFEQIDAGKEVVLEFDLEQKFVPGPIPVYNVVAEIPGTEFPDEVVIVSGHLDSWDGPGSEGCCDNGTGTMVAVEAARILMACGAKPKRTIRFVLWTGEEQGLLGSRAYVEMHKDSLSKISAVFVDDGGTNYQGGLVCLKEMEPILKEAIEPAMKAFPDLPMQIRVVERMPRGGGSDHAPFNAVGVPGFFWMETGRSNYTHVHHTQHDHLDYAIPEYLVQSSTNSAAAAYIVASAPTMLPREAQGTDGGK
ncbi:MAG: hypothetical protein AMXMBFR19_11490 [Chthonomonadaceae bacterium]|uniref:Carboxypeptidase Q n=1 Tax=Candidatus Nitrosymbiomonas proteolyticus TaxID=2608984 RepID=A0A809SFC9_9BACT|nr:peptidase M28 [Candidatus Nitrosymbiomonas proteolyticus]